jgi:glycosyltransferase involved in cell wall biosynthesis
VIARKSTPALRVASVVEPRILVISPVRNEGKHIERVVRAMAAQELTPARWIVLDDHSTDDTLAILRSLEDEVPFLTVAQAPPKPAEGSTATSSFRPTTSAS